MIVYLSVNVITKFEGGLNECRPCIKGVKLREAFAVYHMDGNFMRLSVELFSYFE